MIVVTKIWLDINVPSSTVFVDLSAYRYLCFRKDRLLMAAGFACLSNVSLNLVITHFILPDLELLAIILMYYHLESLRFRPPDFLPIIKMTCCQLLGFSSTLAE